MFLRDDCPVQHLTRSFHLTFTSSSIPRLRTSPPGSHACGRLLHPTLADVPFPLRTRSFLSVDVDPTADVLGLTRPHLRKPRCSNPACLHGIAVQLRFVVIALPCSSFSCVRGDSSSSSFFFFFKSLRDKVGRLTSPRPLSTSIPKFHSSLQLLWLGLGDSLVLSFGPHKNSL